MSAEQEIKQLIEQSEQLDGREQVALLDRAVALADELGDTELGYGARLRRINAAHNAGDTESLLASFAWCVGMHERDPEAHPLQIEWYDLLWYHKWIPSTLAKSPAFAVADIETALQRMEDLYRRQGVGLSGVWQSRFNAAVRRGELDLAEQYFASLERTPRDEYSHCDACVRGDAADFFFATGREEEGLRRFDEIIENQFSCGDEPEATQASALLPLLRAGRFDDALANQRMSYRLIKPKPDMIGSVAEHWVFLAVTGNEERALSLVERHLGWLAHDGLDQTAHFSALVALGATLDAVARAGHGEVPVRGSADARLEPFFADAPRGASAAGGTPSAAGGAASGGSGASAPADRSVAELAVAAWAGAQRLAEAFDARNGNDWYARRIAAGRALAEERYDLPVGAPVAVEGPAVAAEQAEPTDAEGWVRRFRELGTSGEIDAARVAAERAAALAEGEVATRLHLQRAAVELGVDQRAAEAHLERFVAALEADGRTEYAAIYRELGPTMIGSAGGEDAAGLLDRARTTDDPEARADLLVTALAALLNDEADGSLERATVVAAEAEAAAADLGRGWLAQNALWTAAHAALRAGDLDAALARIERLLALDPDRVQRYRALVLRARLLAGGGDFAGALAAGDEGLDLAAALGSRPMVVDAALLTASILGDLEEPLRAIGRLRLALREAELVEGYATTGIRFGLGRQLLLAGDSADAAELLEEVAEEERENDEVTTGSVAETLFWLGRAHQSEGALGDAYRAWSEASERFDEAEDRASACRTKLALADLLARHFGDDDAVELADRAVDDARATGDPQLLAQALHDGGRALLPFQPERIEPLFDEALAIGRGLGADWFVADVTDSRAGLLGMTDRQADAVPVSLQAADLYLAAGDPRSAARAELYAGRLLADLGRHEEATAVLQAIIPKVAGDPQLEPAAALALGDALEALGRHDEAAAARAIAG
jgi:tetratricopeptide (TPR) repeat protein